MGDAAQERLGILGASLAQVLPQLLATGRIGTVLRASRFGSSCRSPENMASCCPLRRASATDLLDAVRPVRLAAQMVDDDDARMLQYVVDVQIDRRRLPQVLHVGEPHARVAVAAASAGALREQ
jgi:hypothetical protein